MITENLKELIVKSLLKQYPDLVTIYLFGSMAQKNLGLEGDIDLAILPRKPLDSFKTWKLAQEFSILLHHEVDLIDLLKASTVMRVQVISKGICLYEGNKRKREVFENYVYSSYARHEIRLNQLGIPQESRDAFHMLYKAGFLEKGLAERMMAMVGFRNIAVHDYQELNLEIVKRIIEKHLEDFIEFSSTFIKKVASGQVSTNI